MSDPEREILDQALRLPRERRMRIGEILIGSGYDEAVAGEDEDWGEMIARRLRGIDSGEVELIPHDQVMANVRAALGE